MVVLFLTLLKHMKSNPDALKRTFQNFKNNCFSEHFWKELQKFVIFLLRLALSTATFTYTYVPGYLNPSRPIPEE